MPQNQTAAQIVTRLIGCKLTFLLHDTGGVSLRFSPSCSGPSGHVSLAFPRRRSIRQYHLLVKGLFPSQQDCYDLRRSRVTDFVWVPFLRHESNQ